jgi:hypothetical protein
MNARPSLTLTAIAFTAITWSVIAPLTAQNVTEEAPEDPIQAAIREFNRRDSEKTNEVTVVLDPVGQSAVAEPPVLVTGKPPDDSKVAEAAPVPKEAGTDGELAIHPEDADAEIPPNEPRKGLSVRVEKLQSGTGNIDPSQVKLLAPFPAKPLADPPAGWLMESSENAPHFTREVELSPGNAITLTVRPHILIPDADGTSVFQVAEPGFDPFIGYHQNATVGAVLSQSIRQLDEDSRQLGTAIENLQQLLVSLPKPEVQPEPQPATNRKR